MFLKKNCFYEICSKKSKVTNTGVYGLYICKNVSLFYKINKKLVICYIFRILITDIIEIHKSPLLCNDSA